MLSLLLLLVFYVEGEAFGGLAGDGFARFQTNPPRRIPTRLAQTLPMQQGNHDDGRFRRTRGPCQCCWTMVEGYRRTRTPASPSGAVGFSCAGGGRGRNAVRNFFLHGRTEKLGNGMVNNNRSAEVELLCDQCGSAYNSGAALSPRPRVGPIEPYLAVCGAPGCGVAFSQCKACEVEYAGCCSAACQALAAEEDAARLAPPVMVSGGKDGRTGQGSASLNGGVGGEPLGLDLTVSAGSSKAGGNREAAATTAAAARRTPSSEQGPVRSGRGEATIPAIPPKPVGGVAAGDGGGGGGDNTIQKQEEDAAEPLLESYASRHSEPESPCLAGIRESTIRAQPGGAHMVSGHLQGGLLKLLARLSGAKRVLDIGTFTGYSALAFAEALPEDGTVVTLESDARAAETARGHFASSEHGGKIQLLLGQAMDEIDQLIAQDSPQFDIIFIDADKKRYWDYYEKVLSGPRPLLARSGILLADNVLFHELVPMAEAMGATAAAAAAAVRTETGNSGGEGGGGGEHLPPSAANLQVVGAGVLAPTPRRLKIAESLDGFNKRVREDARVEVLMLPLRDGLSVVTWRAGGYPSAEQ